VRESDLLQHIYRRSEDLPEGAIVLGPGDDCAVLEGGQLVTVDQLVEGRHYETGASLDLIARKAVGRAVSDIAAMGGTPACGFASAALRSGFDSADELFDLMSRWAREFGCPLAGGDISSVDGPTVLGLTIVGRAHVSRGPVLRSGAHAGDGVYVTGRIGGAVRSGRHLEVTPRVAEGAWLCETLGERLHSMIDLSDGLGRDASRVGVASGVLLELDSSLIPLHEDAGDVRAAIAEGEDYELLFTASGSVEHACSQTGTPVTRIGSVVEGEPGSALRLDGETIRTDDAGWDHE